MSADYLQTGIIIDYSAAPISVGALTLLKEFAPPPSKVDVVEVVLENQDLASTATLQVDVSEGGLPNPDRRQVAVVQPQSEGSVQLLRLLPSLIRISASSEGPGFAPINIRWKVRAPKPGSPN